MLADHSGITPASVKSYVSCSGRHFTSTLPQYLLLACERLHWEPLVESRLHNLINFTPALHKACSKLSAGALDTWSTCCKALRWPHLHRLGSAYAYYIADQIAETRRS